MKRISILLAMFLFTGMLFAQGEAPLAKGESQISFGIGYDSWLGLPIYGTYEYAVHPDVTVGGRLAFDLGGFDGMYIVGKADYHWNRLMGIPKEWDFYTGANLGGDIAFVNGGAGQFHFHVDLGGRYYFSDKWAINFEMGGATSFTALFGVSVKL
jgi:hypothetical protein